MMILRVLKSTLVILSLTCSTLPAAQATSLTVAPIVEPAGADLDDPSRLAGPGIWIVGALVLGLAIWGIIELTDDQEDFPASP